LPIGIGTPTPINIHDHQVVLVGDQSPDCLEPLDAATGRTTVRSVGIFGDYILDTVIAEFLAEHIGDLRNPDHQPVFHQRASVRIRSDPAAEAAPKTDKAL
jgi:hypothetical protein